MKPYKLFLFAYTIAAASVITSSCSNTPYKSQARYWHGHKHTSHYERWK